MIRNKKVWSCIGAAFVLALMMFVKLDEAYAASPVEVVGDVTPFKQVENGETYIHMANFDLVLGEVTTDSDKTQIEAASILDNLVLGENVLDMRIYTDDKGNKEVAFIDAEGIINENSNLTVEGNKAAIPTVYATLGRDYVLNAPEGTDGDYGFKWVQLFNYKGRETVYVGEEEEEVELNMDKYQAYVYESYTGADFDLPKFSKIDESICICFTVDEKGRLSQIAGMYNVVASDEIKVANLKEVKVSARGTYAIKLSWEEADCANGYRLYMRQNNTWKIVANISGTEFVFSGLKAGTSYIFAVRPFYSIPQIDTAWASAATTVTTFTKPLKPAKVVVGKAGRTAINLKWTKSTGATGYVIYKQVGKSWVRVKTVKASTCTIGGLKRNTSYKFAVRPYKIVGGKVDYAVSYTPVNARTLK